MEFELGQIFEGEVPAEAVVFCNNSQNLRIERIKDKQEPIYEQVLEFDTVEEMVKVPQFTEEGEPVLDENGNQFYIEEPQEVKKPVLVEEPYQEPVYDEEGNITGYNDTTRFLQKWHNEIVGYKYIRQYQIQEIPQPTAEELEEMERERISKLKLTKREVFLALYRAINITPEMVRSRITDTEALIEFDYATEYYRGNPLIDSIGAMLGYTPEDLNYLFENKEFPPAEAEEELIGEEEIPF